VHKPTFEEAYPVARELARLKALAVIGHCGFTGGDCEDIEGDLLLDFYTRFPHYDNRRASVRTFAVRVMDRKLTSILRRKQAQCRTHQNLCQSLRDFPLDRNGDAFESDGDVCDADPNDGAELPGSGLERQEFHIDLERVLAPLPPVLIEIAAILSMGSVTDAGRLLGRSRPWVYEQIARLRGAFLAAGIGPHYFIQKAAGPSAAPRPN